MTLKTLENDTSQSKVSFHIKKLGFLTIKGALADFQGNIAFDDNDLENSKFDVSVGAITIDTGNAIRDYHLKSNDFFKLGAPVNTFFPSSFNSCLALEGPFIAFFKFRVCNAFSC